MLPLHRELGLMLAIPTNPSRDPIAAVPAANGHPRGPKAAAVQFPRRETAATAPLIATSPAATLPKTTNGKHMGVARRRRRRRRTLRFLQLLHFAIGIRCANGMLYECSCDVGRGEERAFLDIVVIRQLADYYLNNFPSNFSMPTTRMALINLICSCQEEFWLFTREHLNGL